MPQPAAVNEPVESLLAIWTEAAVFLEAEQARILSDPASIDRYRRRLDRLTDELLPVVAGEMARIRDATADYLADELPAAWRAGAETVSGADRFTWALPHRAAITNLSTRTWSDVLAATTFVENDTRRWVRDAGKRWTQLGLATGLTPTETARRMTRDATLRGIDAIRYSDGSTRTIGQYGRMLLRTTTAQAYNGGTLTETRQLGFTHVEIFDGPGCGLDGHNAVPLADGLVVPIGVAEQYPLAHPNCRRSFGPRTAPPGSTFDTDPSSPAPGSFLYDPSTSADQRTAQAQADADVANRRRRRTGNRPRRPQRTRRSTANEARLRAETAFTPGDGLARLDAAADQIAAAKTKTEKVATQRRRGRPPKQAPQDLLDRHGITQEQWQDARGQLTDIRKSVREAAARDSYLAFERLDQVDARFVQRPDKKKRRKESRGTETVSYTDPNTKKWVRYSRERIVDVTYRDQAGYDWVDTLTTDADYKRWAKPKGRFRAKKDGGADYTPDVLQEAWNTKHGTDLQLDEVMEEIIQLWDLEDGMHLVSQGKIPSYLADATPSEFRDLGYDVTQLFGPDLDKAAAHIAEIHNDHAGQYVRRLFADDTRTGLPQPWELTVDDYADEIGAVWNQAHTAKPLRADEWGEVYAPADQFAIDRLRELAPPEILFDADGNARVLDDIWLEIQELARQAGRLETPGD